MALTEIKQRRQRGALRQEGQRWVLRIRDDVTDADGQCRRPERRLDVGTVAEFPVRSKARQAADTLLARLNPRAPRMGSGMTLTDFAEIFEADHLAMLKPASAHAARSMLRRHITPTLGCLPLDQLQGRAPQLLVNKMAATGCSRKTIKNAVSVLSSLLRLARRYGHPCPPLGRDAITLPPAPVNRERRFFTAADSGRIIQAAPFPWRALYALLAFTGMRIGEALGLAWSHVDFSSGLLHVRQSCVLGQIQTTKSQNSAVDLPMPQSLREILAAFQVHWQPNASGLLFADDVGVPLKADVVRNLQLRPLLKALAIAPAGFHAWRHGHATALFSAGVSAPTVRGLLRHSDLRTTLGYTHTVASEQRDAVERVANLITATMSQR